MKQKIVCLTCMIGLALGLLLLPLSAGAQESKPDGPQLGSHVGSVVLSVFYFPIRLATCVGTQFVTAPAYVITDNVPGNFEGGTNRKEIAEVSRGACASPWVITPSQLFRDYQ